MCLSLLAIAANCDGEFHENERALINGYCALMEIPTDTLRHIDLDEALDFFSHRSEITKRSVFLEVLGLIASDNKYHRAENEIIQKMAIKFKIESHYIEEAKGWINSFLPLYYKGFEMIGVLAGR